MSNPVNRRKFLRGAFAAGISAAIAYPTAKVTAELFLIDSDEYENLEPEETENFALAKLMEDYGVPTENQARELLDAIRVETAAYFAGGAALGSSYLRSII